MRGIVAKLVYIIVFLVLIVVGIWLYAQEDFDQVSSIEGTGNYLIREEPLIPWESPDIFIAEDGKLFLFYIDSELINVYTDSGDYLYSIQFPDGKNGKSDMFYKDGLLYVDARVSGIYVFQDTQLLRFEEQHYQNEGHDELEEVFTGEDNHTDGEYTYIYEEKANRVVRKDSAGSETVLQFPQKKYEPVWLSLVICVMMYAGTLAWGKKPDKQI